MELTGIDRKEQWDKIVTTQGGHPLQLWGWGEAKKETGPWTVRRYVAKEDGETVGGVQVLVRNVPFPFQAVAYVPRGPFGKDPAKIAELIAEEIRQTTMAISITFEPDLLGEFEPEKGQPNSNPILMPRTATIDLTQSVETLRKNMTKKTRQYINRSEKNGVTVRRAENLADIDKCLEIYEDTAQRAGFHLHANSYYHEIYKQMGDAVPVYMAEKDGRVLAFLWLATSPATAFELYGGINKEGQELRANFGLKWAAILDQKERGTQTYDLNGLFNDGISKFKLGFTSGVETNLHPGADIGLNWMYRIWAKALPHARKIRQRRANGSQ